MRFVSVALFSIICLGWIDESLQDSFYWARRELQRHRSPYPGSTQNSEDSDNDSPKIWALLVAGSNGWYNYRHQADIAHGYHVLRNHGIPEENIVTMMYDDIANNQQNPYPGKLFNSPKGKDVYAGVKIDYKGDSVNPKNFLAVLSGDQSGVEGGNGRVLQSTSRDKIFVYFSDHGATGLIAFPDEVLTVKQLSHTLRQMHANQKYAEMTFYLEACESGSMFKNLLPEDLEIYAITAANDHESSWGCYCDTALKLPCLGDLFSVNWMEDSDKENLNEETLETQYGIVKRLTNQSHVCHFGNTQIWKEHVAEFQGNQQSRLLGGFESVMGDESESNEEMESDVHSHKMWPSRDIPILHLIAQRDGEANEYVKAHLSHQIHVMQKKRRYLESQIVEIVKKLIHDENNQKRALTIYPKKLHKHLECHNDVVQAFHRSCFNFGTNSYALKYVYVLANLCEVGIETDRIVTTLMDHCVDIKGNIEEIL
ncbi:peptidase c13 family domain-containing protein [Ditylenchus destructor]|uniref:legumain n=1 Tax=Ditylenchus destructor TaxID=166010 RepID=A0AAD4MTX0_9BILA|nr:peptidase c13 family domain-containing protein [Ditylenchus destructor]